MIPPYSTLHSIFHVTLLNYDYSAHWLQHGKLFLMNFCFYKTKLMIENIFYDHIFPKQIHKDIQ